MEVAMERMSSGSRINSSMDDAAGLAISNRMTSQIDGLNQAIRNANDAISLAQTAEATLDSHSGILQRMRVLAVQAANDTYSTLDRQTLNNEIVQLKEELNRSVSVATFNGQKILDGTNESFTFQVGHVASDTVTIALTDMRGAEIGTRSWSDKDGVIAPTSVGDPDSKAGTIEVPAVEDAVEKDTYQLSGQVTTGGSISFEFNGTRYTQDFDTSHAQTMDNLVAAINANETSYIAARNGDNLELNALTASNIQMPEGTISGALNANSNLTATKVVSVGGAAAVSPVQEVVEHTITGTLTNGDSVTFSINGNLYSETMDTGATPADTHAIVMARLAADVSANEADFDMTFTSGKLVMTAAVGSDTDMPQGTVGGALTSVAAQTTAGVTEVIAAKEENTYTFNNTMDVGGYLDFELNGISYHQEFDQSHPNSLDKLVANINSTDSTVVASRVGNDLVITNVAASDTPMSDATVSGLADNANVLTAAHLDTVVGAASAPIEKDTYELADDITAGGRLVFEFNGNTYTQEFDTDHQTTVNELAIKINQGEDNVIASRDGDNLVIVAKEASDTQMTAGTLSGQTDGTAAVTVTSTVATTGDAEAGSAIAEIEQYASYDLLSLAGGKTLTYNDGTSTFTSAAVDNTGTPTPAEQKAAVDDLIAKINHASTGSSEVTAAVVYSPDSTNPTSFVITMTAKAGSSTAIGGDLKYDGTSIALDTSIDSDTVAGAAVGDPVKEIRTIDIADEMVAGGKIEFAYGDKAYVMDFDTSHSFTLDKLVTAVNNDLSDTFTLARNGNDLVMTATAASDTALSAPTVAVFKDDSVSTNATHVNSIDGHEAVAAIEGSAAINAYDFNGITLEVGDRVSLTVNGNTYIQEFITDQEATLNALGALVVNGEESYQSKAYEGGKLVFTGQDNGTAIENGVMSIETGVVHAADSVDDIIITDSASAKHALTTVDNALEMMAEFRSRMGAMSNRMYHTVSNLMSVSENTSAARSRIQDADFALESANLAKSQVLQQAGTAMLAQANASTKDILSLLK
jgi:flagellin